MNWRSIAFAVIAEVEERYKRESYGAFKRALYDAYPFGSRANYPYRAWCEEQRAALWRHPECPNRPPMGELFKQQANRKENDQ